MNARDKLQAVLTSELQASLSMYKGKPMTPERREEIVTATKKLLSAWGMSKEESALIPTITCTRMLRDMTENTIHVRLEMKPRVYRHPPATVTPLPVKRMTRVGRYTVPACRDCDGTGELEAEDPSRSVIECERCEGTGVEP